MITKIRFEYRLQNGQRYRVTAEPLVRPAAPAFECQDDAGAWHQEPLTHVSPRLLMTLGRIVSDHETLGVATSTDGDTMDIVFGGELDNVASDWRPDRGEPFKADRVAPGLKNPSPRSKGTAMPPTKTEITRGSIRATVTSGGNIELATVHRGGLHGALGNVEIQRADLGDVIGALQEVQARQSDRAWFDGRPPRTRSCPTCHTGAMPDPYSLAFLDQPVAKAPDHALMAMVVGSADIFEVTREAHEVAIAAGRPVAIDFSGITVVVERDDEPDQIARAWWWTKHGCTPEQSAERR